MSVFRSADQSPNKIILTEQKLEERKRWFLTSKKWHLIISSREMELKRRKKKEETTSTENKIAQMKVYFCFYKGKNILGAIKLNSISCLCRRRSTRPRSGVGERSSGGKMFFPSASASSSAPLATSSCAPAESSPTLRQLCFPPRWTQKIQKYFSVEFPKQLILPFSDL